MNGTELDEYKKQISNLNVNEQKLRDLYLRKIALGEIQGPMTGYPSIDKPWLKFYSEEAIVSQIKDISLFQNIVSKNENNLEAIAIDYYGVKISYKKLFRKIKKATMLFKDMGINENTPVTICLPNIPEFIYVFYALNELGAQIRLIDPRTKGENISDFINNSELYITYDDSYLESYRYIEKTNTKQTIVISPFDSLPCGLRQILKRKNRSAMKILESENKKLLLWNQFFSKSTKKQQVISSKKGTVIVNTGGTTGKPKGVVLNNQAINGVVLEYEVAGFNFNRRDKIMFNVPNSLAYGLVISLHLPLTLGMYLQVIAKFDPEKYDQLILKYKPNHIVGIPDWYQQMYNSKDLAKLNLSFVKTAASGGSPMNSITKQKSDKFLNEHNAECFIVEGYGMTETASSAATNLLNINIPHSVGIPLVKNIISIFDPETQEELPYNSVGEICITGPTVMEGYYNNSIESDKIMKYHDGYLWIHTGDIGKIDNSGVLYVTGRIKRIIETYTTHKIYSESVEELIMSNPKIESCAIISLPDIVHQKGFVAKAMLKIYPSFEFEAEEILKEVQELCSSSLEDYSVPIEYEIIDEMPLTDSEKINYKLLEDNERKKIDSKIKKRIK